jgi:hypothetical protein
LRVLVFVLGRTGPWLDFDVRPAYRATHDARWSWFGVIFAATLAATGIFAVIAIAWLRHRHRVTRG